MGGQLWGEKGGGMGSGAGGVEKGGGLGRREPLGFQAGGAGFQEEVQPWSRVEWAGALEGPDPLALIPKGGAPKNCLKWPKM